MPYTKLRNQPEWAKTNQNKPQKNKMNQKETKNEPKQP